MNLDTIRACKDQHLVDKSSPDTSARAGEWFAAAKQNFASARSIVKSDENGAQILVWSSMQKLAKTLVALCGCRLDDETHGKIADGSAPSLVDA